MTKKLYAYRTEFRTSKGAEIFIVTTAHNEDHAEEQGRKCCEGEILDVINIKKIVPNYNAKNYMLIVTTGNSAYSSAVRAYKVVNNVNVFIGDLYGVAQDKPIHYLHDILRSKGSKIDIENLYNEGKVNIQEIIV